MDWQTFSNSSARAPRWLPHPVVLMGKFISINERCLLTFLLATGLASTTLATRGLREAVARIETPLRSGNLVGAPENLARIVGRDTSALNQDKVMRARLPGGEALRAWMAGSLS